MTNSHPVTFSMEAAEKRSNAGLGWLSGGVMILVALALWGAAAVQLHFFAPKTFESTFHGKMPQEFRKVFESPVAFPWRLVATYWVIPAAALSTLALCAVLRFWWVWGSLLVALPLFVNWYLTFAILIPYGVILFEMKPYR